MAAFNGWPFSASSSSIEPGHTAVDWGLHHQGWTVTTPYSNATGITPGSIVHPYPLPLAPSAQADIDWQQFVDWHVQTYPEPCLEAAPEPAPLPTRRAMALDGHIPAGA